MVMVDVHEVCMLDVTNHMFIVQKSEFVNPHHMLLQPAYPPIPNNPTVLTFVASSLERATIIACREREIKFPH